MRCSLLVDVRFLLQHKERSMLVVCAQNSQEKDRKEGTIDLEMLAFSFQTYQSNKVTPLSASLVAQLVKKSVRNVGDLGSIPGLRKSLGEDKGYPLQYSGLENSLDCERLTGRKVRGLQTEEIRLKAPDIFISLKRQEETNQRYFFLLYTNLKGDFS